MDTKKSLEIVYHEISCYPSCTFPTLQPLLQPAMLHEFLQCITKPQVPWEKSQRPQCRTCFEAGTYLNRMQIEINIKAKPGWERSWDLFATKPRLPSDYQTGLSDDNAFFLLSRKTRLRGNIGSSALTRFDKWWSNTDDCVLFVFIQECWINTARTHSVIWSGATDGSEWLPDSFTGARDHCACWCVGIQLCNMTSNQLTLRALMHQLLLAG